MLPAQEPINRVSYVKKPCSAFPRNLTFSAVLDALGEKARALGLLHFLTHAFTCFVPTASHLSRMAIAIKQRRNL